MVYRGTVLQPGGKKRDCREPERRLRQGKEDAEELYAERNRDQDERPDKLADAFGRECEHSEEIVEFIEILEQAFHGHLPCD